MKENTTVYFIKLQITLAIRVHQDDAMKTGRFGWVFT